MAQVHIRSIVTPRVSLSLQPSGTSNTLLQWQATTPVPQGLHYIFPGVQPHATSALCWKKSTQIWYHMQLGENRHRKAWIGLRNMLQRSRQPRWLHWEKMWERSLQGQQYMRKQWLSAWKFWRPTSNALVWHYPNLSILWVRPLPKQNSCRHMIDCQVWQQHHRREAAKWQPCPAPEHWDGLQWSFRDHVPPCCILDMVFWQTSPGSSQYMYSGCNFVMWSSLLTLIAWVLHPRILVYSIENHKQGVLKSVFLRPSTLSHDHIGHDYKSYWQK